MSVETQEMRHWASTQALKNAVNELKRTYWNHREVYLVKYRDSGRFDGFDTTGIDIILTLQHGETENFYPFCLQLKSSKERLDEHLSRPGQDIPCVANDARLAPMVDQLKEELTAYIDSLFLDGEIDEEGQAAIEELAGQRKAEESRRKRHQAFIKYREKWIGKAGESQSAPRSFNSEIEEEIFLGDLLNGERIDELVPGMGFEGYYTSEIYVAALWLKQKGKEISHNRLRSRIHDYYCRWDVIPQRYFRALENVNIKLFYEAGNRQLFSDGVSPCLRREPILDECGPYCTRCYPKREHRSTKLKLVS